MKKFGTAASFMRHFQGLVKTEVFDSPIAGKGLRALTPAAAGQVVGFYGGRKFASAEEWTASGAADGRYLFSLGNGTVIDGKGTRMGRINHSCEPNLTVVPVVLGLQAEMMFLTQREIRAGEELTLDYNIAQPGCDDVDLTQWVCHCGAKRCRGWMWDPDILRSVRHRGKHLPATVA